PAPAAAPEPECTPKVVFDQTPAETGANLRADPDGEVLLEIPNCTEVCVYEVRDGWARVSASPRDVGFIHESRLLPTDTARCNP
ncbi:MAG: hypothetical protein K8M05_31305, partial [Deltaproteobacteria bacterium]|nr:hypothetical protein [Kofleriaceae bacterium]